MLLYYRNPSQPTEDQNKLLDQLQSQWKKKTPISIKSADYLFFCITKLKKLIYQTQCRISKDEKKTFECFQSALQQISKNQWRTIFTLNEINNVQYGDKTNAIQEQKVISSIKDQFKQFFAYISEGSKKSYQKMQKLYQTVHQKLNLFYPIRADLQKDIKSIRVLNSYMRQLLLSMAGNKKQIQNNQSNNKAIKKEQIKKEKQKQRMSQKIAKLKKKMQENDEEFKNKRHDQKNTLDIMEIRKKYDFQLQRTIDVTRRGLDIWISDI